MKTTEHKAVIDRIEEGKWAVLLVGKDETEKIVPIEHLPADAKAGTWLRLRLEEDIIQGIVVDAEETTAIRGRVESKMAGLRSRQRRFKPVASQNEKQQDEKQIEPPVLQGDDPKTDAPDVPYEGYFDFEGYE